MGTRPSFERSVFINCPFDDSYTPILHAIAFTTIDLGFFPRLAPENADSSAIRLDRIVDLMRSSKYAIHDLSRCRSSRPGEWARLNMPFELGMDYACRRFGDLPLSEKAILVLEDQPYDYQRALSDIAGWDIFAHQSDYIEAVRFVTSWLHRQADAPRIGASRILGNYATFQEWYWKRELEAGSSEDDIRSYPTAGMIKAMHDWADAGRPT